MIPPIRQLYRRLRALYALDAPWSLTARFWYWVASSGAREQAFHAAPVLAALLVFAAVADWPGGTLDTIVLVALAAAFAVELLFAVVAWRSLTAIDEQMEGLPQEPPRLRFPPSHILLPPLMLVAGSVERRRGIVYLTAPGRRRRLDVYLPKAADPGERRPAIVQVHGGGWIAGSRVEQGIPLLNHLAANGWVGFSIDYALSPKATMPDHVIDVKRALAWVREHADEYSVDPERICITGGSAGGHLTALAALTANDPALQPGFEHADTSVAAAVPFYGVYDLLDEARLLYPGLREWLLERVVVKASRSDDPEAFRRASPIHRIHADAPPFLLFHGDRDTLVPVASARAFVERLRATSRQRVRYVEVPGAEHAFDITPTPRTVRVVEGIERFLRTAVAEPRRERTSAAA